MCTLFYKIEFGSFNYTLNHYDDGDNGDDLSEINMDGWSA